jgi:hypothetical protein
MTDFVNLKIKLAQFFKGAHRGRMCIRMFISMSAHTCMNICVYTVFLKNDFGYSYLVTFVIGSLRHCMPFW